MATIYITSVDDRLDKIAARSYGTGSDTTTTIGRYLEQIIEANKGIEDYDFLLPAGLKITLPVIANTSVTTTVIKRVNLWD